MILITLSYDLKREIKRKLVTPNLPFVEMKENFGKICLIIFGGHQERAVVLDCIRPKVSDPGKIEFDEAGFLGMATHQLNDFLLLFDFGFGDKARRDDSSFAFRYQILEQENKLPDQFCGIGSTIVMKQ